jgi:hypothetical protein
MMNQASESLLGTQKNDAANLIRGSKSKQRKASKQKRSPAEFASSGPKKKKNCRAVQLAVLRRRVRR